MIKINSVAKPPEALRNAYLDGLIESQELFLEDQVMTGNTWSIADIAYAVTNGSKLVEFFVVPEQADQLVECFDAFMLASGATSILCKSYDTQTLYAALSKPANVQPRGLLFRRMVSVSRPASGLIFRLATQKDAEKLFEFNDDFFASVQEIILYAEIDGLFVLEKDEDIVGCGIGKPIVNGRDEIDIGMLVHRKHRKKGYGTYIVHLLTEHFLGIGLSPVCGCGLNNIASQKTLRNAGFISEHRILEVTYAN